MLTQPGLGSDFDAYPANRGRTDLRREEDGGFSRDNSGQAFGLGDQSCPLAIVQQDALVLFLLLNQDTDLFPEIINRFVEFPVEIIR